MCVNWIMIRTQRKIADAQSVIARNLRIETGGSCYFYGLAEGYDRLELGDEEAV